MGDKLLKRSGLALCKVARLLNWKPDLIVQVGIGFYHKEIDVMKKEWPDVLIVGFEPHPLIMKNVKGKYPGQIIEAAVGSMIGTTTLYVKPSHKEGSSTKRFNDMSKRQTIEVKQTRLDSHSWEFNGNGRVLLWLDCEGSELDALKGGIKLMESVDVINVEMTPNPPSREWADPRDTHRWLTDHGFKRQTVHTNRTSEGQYDAIYVRKEIHRPKYCCDPF